MMKQALFNTTRISTRQLHSTPINYSIVGGAKKVLEQANKKTGEVLASGLDKSQETPGPKEAAKKINKKTGEKLAEGLDEAEKVSPTSHPAQSKVKDNTKGYNGLQDKGSKTETEQNRPDDAV